LKRVLFIFSHFVFFCFTSIAQDDKLPFSGEVSDKNGTKLPNVHIVDLNTRIGTLTNRDGLFLLNVNKADTVRLSFTGFKTKIFVVPDIPEDSLKTLPIIMTRDTLMLKQATIYPYPATFQQFKQEFITLNLPDTTPKVNLHLKDILTFINFDLKDYQRGQMNLYSGSLISMLYNKFSHEGKMRRKYIAVVEHDRLINLAAEIYSDSLITKITGLTDEDIIDAFREYCDLDTNFILNASEYELYAAVIECYERFKDKGD
jgi:hypothetical protein